MEEEKEDTFKFSKFSKLCDQQQTPNFSIFEPVPDYRLKNGKPDVSPLIKDIACCLYLEKFVFIDAFS